MSWKKKVRQQRIIIINITENPLKNTRRIHTSTHTNTKA